MYDRRTNVPAFPFVNRFTDESESLHRLNKFVDRKDCCKFRTYNFADKVDWRQYKCVSETAHVLLLIVVFYNKKRFTTFSYSHVFKTLYRFCTFLVDCNRCLHFHIIFPSLFDFVVVQSSLKVFFFANTHH